MRAAIIRPGALGDVLAVRSAAGFLRAAAPMARIILLAAGERGRLLARSGVVDESFDLDSAEIAWLFGGTGAPPPRLAGALAACRYAFAYFTDQNGVVAERLRALGCQEIYFHPGRPSETDAIHIHEHLLVPLRAALGNVPGGDGRPLPLRLPQLDVATALARWSLVKPYAVIHPGSGSKRKNWPLARFAEVGAALQRKYSLAIVSGEADGKLGEALQAAIARETGISATLVRASLYEVACLLAAAALFLGNDSGIAHLAAAVAIDVQQECGQSSASRPQCIVLFGPSSPVVWAPPGAKIIAARHGEITEIPVAEVISACGLGLQ